MDTQHRHRTGRVREARRSVDPSDTLDSHPLLRRFLAGAAGLATTTVGAVAFAAPAQAVLPEQESSVEFENTCEGTLVTLHSGTELDAYEWVIFETEGEGGAFIEELKPGESLTRLAPSGWGTIGVQFEGQPEGWPQKWTWEKPEGCSEIPAGYGEWSFDCETLEITFISPMREPATFSFEASTGEVKEVALDVGESTTVKFPSSEGLVVEIQVDGELLVDPLEITPERWAEADCDPDGGEGDGGQGGEDGDDEELPLTGGSTLLIVGGAVVLLALGGGLFLLARRRRMSFTA